MSRRSPRWFAPAALAGALAACAGYEARVKDVRHALARGDRAAALAAINKQLKVKDGSARPAKIDGGVALLLLERAQVLQALGRYQDASRDLEDADKHLELLDLSKDTAGNIGKYIYSDDVAVYKAPPHEKLLLSTMNLINYLARGDLSGARVEARRYTVMRNYLRDLVGPDKARFGLGSYLAGFAFEKSGQADEALRHYDEALAAQAYPSLDLPIARLAGRGGYRSPRIAAVLERVGAPPPEEPGAGEVLIVQQSGLAPQKVPERFPVGLFFAWAYDVSHPRYAMTPAQRANADRVIAKGLLKWVNFPVLKRPPRRVRAHGVHVAGRPAASEPALDVTARVTETHEAIKPMLIVAAATRLIARALAGAGTEKVVKGASDSGVVGLLAGLAVEAALTAKDTPDTRSWTALPADVALARARVPAGRHEVVGDFSSDWGPLRHRAQVEVRAGGYALANFTETR